MAQPTPYTRSTNFNDYSTSNPSSPHQGSSLDAEFNALKTTTDQIRSNLAVIQRDDGKLSNLSVHAESLSNAVLTLIKATSNGYGVKGSWAASTAYAIGDLVESSQATYLCFEAHTSGSTFGANSSKFILLANAAIQTTASAVDKFSGDASTQAFTLTNNTPSGETDVLVFVNGSLLEPTTAYTVTSSQISFTTAPSQGTNNVIVWGTSTAVEAAKQAALSARDTAETHKDDANEHKQTANFWATKVDGTVIDADTSVDSNEYSSKSYATSESTPTTIYVTVANGKFVLNGKTISSGSDVIYNVIKGTTYTFDVSDTTNSGHQLEFSISAEDATPDYTVTRSGTAGQANATVTFAVPSDAAATIYFYCSVSGHSGMGATLTSITESYAPSAGSAKEWASKTDGQVASSEYSSKAYASSTDVNEPTTGSSKNWATKTASAEVQSGQGYSSKTYAQDTTASADTTGGSSKGWASTAEDTAVPGASSSDYSAKHWAAKAETQATNATNQNRFLAPASSDPATRADNSALQTGDFYFNTTDNKMKVRNDATPPAWQDTSSSISSVASVEEFTASNGQGTDSKYFAVVHDVGLEIVWLNGVRLKRGDDYICTTANTDTTPLVPRTAGNSANFVRLETVPGSSDILSVMAFGQIDNNLAVNKAGGTFTGGVTFEAGTTHNTGSNTFTMPTTRGSDNYVLTRDDSAGTGGTAWKETALAPTITSIKYSEQTSGTFVENTGQTATEASASTPELCQIIGQNFNASMTISVGGTSAGSVVVNSGGTQATFTPPSKSAGSYTLIATNPNGLTANTSISYDADPAWVTASAPSSSLGNFVDGSIAGTNGPQIVASESGSNLTTGYKQVTSNTDNTVITSGVAGLTIGDNGYLTGTLAGTNGATNNFYAIAVDNEGQQSAIRQFKFVSYDYSANGGQNSLNNSGNTIRYHVFTNTGTSVFQVFPSSLTIDIFLVAGGGAGPRSGGGGGGAGEVVWKTGLQLSTGSYNVVVGAGGPGDQETGSGRPANGTDTTFALGVSGKEVKAKGGGTGGVNAGGNQAGMSGGSGGGSSRDGGNASAASASKYGTGSASDQQGIGYANAGGVSGGTSWSSASGGGGAGGAGGNGSGNGHHGDPHYGDGGSGGAGGVGIRGSDIHSDVTALMTDTSIGVEHGGVRYIAGGGGGSMQHYDSNSPSDRVAGPGGYGGGGVGVKDTNTETNMAGHGTANTGGGGGGGLFGSTATNGGSGIVVIRYAIS